MSEMQTLWWVLWSHAASDPSPFEIDEILPEAAERANLDQGTARRRLLMLLGELDRLPNGQRFFRLEGNAIVPLEAFRSAASKDQKAALAAYPFEL